MISLLNNKNNEIILYGAGFLAPDFIWFCRKNNIKIKYILDKKFNRNEIFLGIHGYSPINYHFSKKEKEKNIVIITIIKEKTQKEVKKFLKKIGFKKVFLYNEVREYNNYLQNFLKLLPEKKKNKFFKNSDTKEVAVILHLYYPDLVNEVVAFLSNISESFSLYVSIPPTLDCWLIKKQLSEGLPQAEVSVYVFENKGRDIAPFLKILKTIITKNYKQILKIHTKKSLHVNFGTLWRRQLYFRLIGSFQCYNKVKYIFKKYNKVGLIAPLGYLYPLKYYLGNTEEKIKNLLNIFKIDWDKNISKFVFVAGTMFWFRPEVFKKLGSLDNSFLIFEPEAGQLDGTLAHALERFFGILPVIEGYKILQMDEEGKIYEQ